MKANELRRGTAKLFLASVGVAGFTANAFGADNTFSWIGPAAVGGNTSWSFATNWQGGVAPPVTPAVGDNTILVFGGNLNAGTATQNATGGATNPADYNLYGIVFNDYTVAAGGGGTFVLTTTGAGSRVINLGAGGIVDNTTGAGSVNINVNSTATDGRLVLTADQDWNVVNNPGTNNLVVRRQVVGAFTVSKVGLGTLQLSSAAGQTLFSGTLDLKQGGIRLDTVGNQLGSATMAFKVDTNNDTTMSASGGTTLDQTIAGPAYFGGTGSFGFSGSWNFTFTNTTTLLGGSKRISQSGTRTANFDGSIVGPGGITKFGGGTIAFHGSNSYAGDTAVASGTLSIGSFGQLGTATTNITLGSPTGAPPPSGTLLVTGTGADATTSRGITLEVGGGNLMYTDTLTINNSISGTGPLTKVSAGQLNVNSINSATFTMSTGTTKMAPDGSDAAVNSVRALVLGGSTGAWTSKLDLDNNSLIVARDVADPNPFADVADQIKQGYNGGAWNGTGGITSSAAAAAGDTALGYGESSVVLGPSGGTFKGHTVDGNATLVRYTYYGDADLNGGVDTVDFNLLASNFGASGKVWTDADFNFDGVVDTVDFNLLAANFGKTLPGDSLGSVVPEPASIFGVGMLGLAVATRRGRRVSGRATIREGDAPAEPRLAGRLALPTARSTVMIREL